MRLWEKHTGLPGRMIFFTYFNRADIAGAAVELAFYRAISLILGGLIVSALVGVAVELSGLGSVISDLADAVSELFTPVEDGIIFTGSTNTHTNSKPAAQAAGILIEEVAGEPEQPESFIDTAKNILKNFGENPVQSITKADQEFMRPTVASPQQLVIPQNEDTITCAKHPSPVSSPEYLAEGSKKVYINSQPAVRSNDRSTCEAKVTDDCEGGIKVSNNIRIGGESVVVREIRSGKHPIGQLISLATLVFNRKKICSSTASTAVMKISKAGSLILPVI